MAKKKILIVDDKKDVLLMLGKRLMAEGYSVLTADNGKDAITIAKSKSPDLIILDVLMPGMDGCEVAERLKDDFRTQNIPIIFLTALLTRNSTVISSCRPIPHYGQAFSFSNVMLIVVISSTMSRSFL